MYCILSLLVMVFSLCFPSIEGPKHNQLSSQCVSLGLNSQFFWPLKTTLLDSDNPKMWLWEEMHVNVNDDNWLFCGWMNCRVHCCKTNKPDPLTSLIVAFVDLMYQMLIIFTWFAYYIHARFLVNIFIMSDTSFTGRVRNHSAFFLSFEAQRFRSNPWVDNYSPGHGSRLMARGKLDYQNMLSRIHLM